MGTLRTTGTRLALFAGCAALVALAACTPRQTGAPIPESGGGGEAPPANGSGVSLSYSWWGGDNRTKLQNAVVDQFEAKNAGIAFRVQTAGDTSSHIERLAVQASGRNLPDLYQMQDRFIRQFSDGDSMLPLDDLVADGTIDVSDLPPEVLRAGQWDGKQLMIGTSFSFRGLYYNEKAFTDAGVEPPNPKTTWDQLAEKVFAVHQAGKLAKGSYASLNNCGSDIAFYSFLGGLDIKPYDGDKIGFTAAEVGDWFGYWDQLAKAGAVPPAALQVEQQGNTTEDSMFAKKLVMVDIFPANQYETTHEINPDTRVTGVPAGPKGPGNYLIVSGQSISGRTQHAKEAAKFIDFFLNDVEAAKTYKADNGLPAANKTREAVAQSLKLRQFELYDEIKDDLTQQDPAPPGSAEVISALERSCDELAFGRQSVGQAAEQFVTAASQAIDRS